MQANGQGMEGGDWWEIGPRDGGPQHLCCLRGGGEQRQAGGEVMKSGFDLFALDDSEISSVYIFCRH